MRRRWKATCASREQELILVGTAAPPTAIASETAQRLGISPRTLRYKLARLREQGVDLPLGALRQAADGNSEWSIVKGAMSDVAINQVLAQMRAMAASSPVRRGHCASEDARRPP
jgi:predicted DNA-binding transcriptional regulator YafY